MNQNYLSSAEQRSRAILDAYGSWPAAWPDDERQATLDCIAQSPALQHYQLHIQTLDTQIHRAQTDALSAEAEITALQQRILTNLPVHTRGHRRFFPASGRLPRLFSQFHLPRYTLALAGMMILILAMTLHHAAPVVTTNPPAEAAFAAWSWYDITGQELPARQTSTALTMTDLIDLETGQVGG
ncbi:MAG: hypothetical protein P8Z75_04780 [Gammaproteobacteria bacterium]